MRPRALSVQRGTSFEGNWSRQGDLCERADNSQQSGPYDDFRELPRSKPPTNTGRARSQGLVRRISIRTSTDLDASNYNIVNSNFGLRQLDSGRRTSSAMIVNNDTTASYSIDGPHKFGHVGGRHEYVAALDRWSLSVAFIISKVASRGVIRASLTRITTSQISIRSAIFDGFGKPDEDVRQPCLPQPCSPGPIGQFSSWIVRQLHSVPVVR